MTVYFDRELPLFLTTEAGFTAIEVDVDPRAAQFISDLNRLVKATADLIDESGAAEDYNQGLAEDFVRGIEEILGAAELRV